MKSVWKRQILPQRRFLFGKCILSYLFRIVLRLSSKNIYCSSIFTSIAHCIASSVAYSVVGFLLMRLTLVCVTDCGLAAAWKNPETGSRQLAVGRSVGCSFPSSVLPLPIREPCVAFFLSLSCSRFPPPPPDGAEGR